MCVLVPRALSFAWLTWKTARPGHADILREQIDGAVGR
jgi:hypothetical protein